MNIKNQHLYSKETLEFCNHAKMISNVDRVYIIQLITEYNKCRVNQIVMETGLSVRQVYYQLSVLRKLNYISTEYNKGRYFIYPGLGIQRGNELLGTLLKRNQSQNETASSPLRSTSLRIVK